MSQILMDPSNKFTTDSHLYKNVTYVVFCKPGVAVTEREFTLPTSHGFIGAVILQINGVFTKSLDNSHQNFSLYIFAPTK